MLNGPNRRRRPRWVTVHVEAHPISTTEGLWCHHCLLPSGVEVEYRLANVETLRVLVGGVSRFCRECQQPLPHVMEDDS